MVERILPVTAAPTARQTLPAGHSAPGMTIDAAARPAPAQSDLPGRPHTSVALAPPTDPDQPTGPPPAFEANVLEAEALRRANPDLSVRASPAAATAEPFGGDAAGDAGPAAAPRSLPLPADADLPAHIRPHQFDRLL